MPLYQYFCSECNKEFELRHSYKEKITVCVLCDKEGGIRKILSTTNFALGKNPTQKQKTGTITNKAIEDARVELEKQKKELKKKNK
tara:strand:+ start:89 stop:346 length:258 start_codon:yes stop_codon:yes gene_type:complete